MEELNKIGKIIVCMTAFRAARSLGLVLSRTKERVEDAKVEVPRSEYRLRGTSVLTTATGYIIVVRTETGFDTSTQNNASVGMGIFTSKVRYPAFMGPSLLIGMANFALLFLRMVSIYSLQRDILIARKGIGIALGMSTVSTVAIGLFGLVILCSQSRLLDNNFI